MAEVKNYGLSGVHRTLQLGKQGPVLVGNADTDSFTVTLQDAATLTTLGGANATSGTHFITKSQLDSVYTEATFLANVNYNDTSPILLGNISSGTKTIITTFDVTTAFNANAVVTIGTSANANLLMSDNYAEIEVVGTYQTINTVEFASNSALNIYVTQGGATQGAGTVLVSVVDGPVVNGGTINYGAGGGGIALANLSVSVNSPSGNGSLTYSNSTGVFTFTPADASLSNYGNSNVVTLLSSFGSNSISTIGNISANAFVLPGGGTITENTYGFAGSIRLKPIGGSATQYLEIAPTGGGDGDHVHLMSGGGTTELFLGNDNQYVKLASNGAIVVNSANVSLGKSAQWTFGIDGNLTFPTGNLVITPDDPAGNIASIVSTNHPLGILSTGANGAVSSLWVEDIGNVGTSNIAAVYANPTVGSKIVRIAVGQNGGGGPNLWDFDATGNLTLPGNTFSVNYANGTQVSLGGGGIALANLSVSVNSPSGNGSLTYSNSTGVFTFTPANLSSVAGNYGNSNVVTLLSSLGSNTIVTTGNISAGNILTSAEVIASGVIQSGTGLSTGGYLSVDGAADLHNTTVTGNISATGNVTANNFIGNISITGNVAGTSANVTLVAGAYSTVFDNTGNTAFANGTVSLTTLSATGNITSGNITTTGNVSGNTAGFAIGYRDIPQVSFTSNATITTSDAGKHYYSTLSTSNVLTIANNTSQSFQVGAAITIVNQGTGNITVAQGSGVTLYVAGNATSGNRTVTTFGMATIIKVATNTWFINGTGVS